MEFIIEERIIIIFLCCLQKSLQAIPKSYILPIFLFNDTKRYILLFELLVSYNF